MSEPITPADARAEINRVLGDAAHPYWDRQHPEHRAAMERMQVLFAVKVGRFGPPIEYTTAREQDRAEGYRAGIEAAAQWHDEMAFEWDGYGGSESREYAKNHRADARSIRALADKPAPDALLPGLQHIMAYMIREPWTADTIRTFIQCEIAARKGG